MKTRGDLKVLYAFQGEGDTGKEEIHCLMQHDDGVVEYIPLFPSGLYWVGQTTEYDIVEGIEDVINR